MSKGIILAGGSGTRLNPLTSYITKQLLPVYNKPMIYYSISVLMLAGVRDILIISDPKNINKIKEFLGNGSKFGLKISFAVQKEPKGIVEALIIGEEFITNSDCFLILGDNFFYGNDLMKILKKVKKSRFSSIFTYKVRDPFRFGILKKNNNVLEKIIEKPKKNVGEDAVTGLYFYKKGIVEYAKKIKPSERGELEISDLNNLLIKHKKLKEIELGRGFAWMDAGTFDSLIEVSQFIMYLEKRQGLMVCCPEEIAYNNNWISSSELKKMASNYKNEYGEYLLKLIG